MPSSSAKVLPPAPPATDPEGLHFPMYVVPIHAMIQICKSPGILPAHEEVMASGKLVQYNESLGPVVFFSHTWLGWRHPDPREVKKSLIVELLEGVLDGSVRVKPYWLSAIVSHEKGIPAKVLRKEFESGYVWLVRRRGDSNQRSGHGPRIWHRAPRSHGCRCTTSSTSMAMSRSRPPLLSLSSLSCRTS